MNQTKGTTEYRLTVSAMSLGLVLVVLGLMLALMLGVQRSEPVATLFGASLVFSGTLLVGLVVSGYAQARGSAKSYERAKPVVVNTGRPNPSI